VEVKAVAVMVAAAMVVATEVVMAEAVKAEAVMVEAGVVVMVAAVMVEVATEVAVVAATGAGGQNRRPGRIGRLGSCGMCSHCWSRCMSRCAADPLRTECWSTLSRSRQKRVCKAPPRMWCLRGRTSRRGKTSLPWYSATNRLDMRRTWRHRQNR
jgi:hypothetical protein